MLKHRGFPGRMPGTDFQFTIRRANVKEGATKLIRRERLKDRKHLDRAADTAFMAALWQYFGEEVFERGNLDAGRLSWLFGREVVAAEDAAAQHLAIIRRLEAEYAGRSVLPEDPVLGARDWLRAAPDVDVDALHRLEVAVTDGLTLLPSGGVRTAETVAPRAIRRRTSSSPIPRLAPVTK